jgi:hypothetical protein
MKFLLETSKIGTALLLFIFLSNWNNLSHIADIRIAVVLLLSVMVVTTQFVSYKVYNDKNFFI